VGQAQVPIEEEDMTASVTDRNRKLSLIRGNETRILVELDRRVARVEATARERIKLFLIEDDAVMLLFYKQAAHAVNLAQRKIDERSNSLGIPRSLAPNLQFFEYDHSGFFSGLDTYRIERAISRRVQESAKAAKRMCRELFSKARRSLPDDIEHWASALPLAENMILEVDVDLVFKES
jgi:hypothetical protein